MVHDAGEAGDVLGDGDAFVLGLVREHRAGDDVADRTDAGRRGVEVVADLDLAALVGGQARTLQRQVERIGPPAVSVTVV